MNKTQKWSENNTLLSPEMLYLYVLCIVMHVGKKYKKLLKKFQPQHWPSALAQVFGPVRDRPFFLITEGIRLPIRRKLK